MLSSDCGFGRQGVPRPIALYKAAALAQGANIVRGELGAEQTNVRAADPGCRSTSPRGPRSPRRSERRLGAPDGLAQEPLAVLVRESAVQHVAELPRAQAGRHLEGQPSDLRRAPAQPGETVEIRIDPGQHRGVDRADALISFVPLPGESW